MNGVIIVRDIVVVIGGCVIGSVITMRWVITMIIGVSGSSVVNGNMFFFMPIET